MKDPRIARSQQQERDGMVRFGGYQNPRSGATPTKKNDGRTSRNLGNELIEFKRTDNKRSIRIDLDDLLDVEIHALAQSRSPILGFDLGGRHYVVMPEEVYFERTAPSIRPSLGGDRIQPGLGDDPPVDDRREMQRSGAPAGQPVLRRVQGQPGGSSGKNNLQGRGVRWGRRVPREVPVPEARDIQTGAEWGMGRGLRARKTPDTSGNRGNS